MSISKLLLKLVLIQEYTRLIQKLSLRVNNVGTIYTIRHNIFDIFCSTMFTTLLLLWFGLE